MNRITAFFFRNEILIITSIALIFASSFFFLGHFVTIDGPAHVYNSGLIAQKLFGTNPQIDQYYSWNTDLVPNWTGHLLLVILKFFFSGSTAEKLMLSIYLLGMVFSFRYLIRSIYPSNGYLSLLIIPFVFNTFLYYGFYNFCISLIFIFWVGGFLISHKDKWNTQSYLLFGCLLLLSYFSHLSGFIVVGLFVFIFILTNSIIDLLKRPSIIKPNIRNAVMLFLVSIPSLILFFIYWKNHHGGGSLIYLEYTEVLKFYWKGNALISYGDTEMYWTKKMMKLILFILFSLTIYRIIKRDFFNLSDFIIITGVAVIVLSFILPDSDSRGGYMTLRLVLMSCLLVVAWISTQKINHVLQALMIMCFLFISAKHIQMRLNTQQLLNEIANEIDQAAELVTENSVILPLYRPSDWDWLTAHMNNYLCADQSCIMLENYEAPQDYFPLRYKTNLNKQVVFSFEKEFYCNDVVSKINNGNVFFNYVLEFGTDLNAQYPCENEIDNFINQSMKPLYQGKYVKLYAL